MNKLIIGAVVIVVLVGGGLFIANQQSQKEKTAMMQEDVMKKDDKMKKDSDNDAMMQKDNVMMEETDDKMMESNTHYVPYSKAVLDQAANTRRVLFFYANWCPTCRPADANFTANVNKIPDDVTLIRVNYNDPDTDQEEKDLAKKYEVTYQHTFVQIDKNGKVVTKWNGGQIDELLANLK